MNDKKRQVELYTDGGARGNPGPAACGVRIISDALEPREQLFGEAIGSMTNNVAEYRALLLGLNKVTELLGVDQCKTIRLVVYSDSELMVRQLKGVYRVRDTNLIKLFEEARELLRCFGFVALNSIPREKNVIADGIVNRVLDQGRFSMS